MAQITTTLDDLTGDSLPAGTPTTRVTIADPRWVDGPSFEIDLSDTSFKELEKALRKFHAKGRTITTPVTATTTNEDAKRFAAEARQWALAQPASAGLKVSPVGKVSQAVLDAYREALSASEDTPTDSGE